MYEKVISNTDIAFGNEDESSAFGKTHGVEADLAKPNIYL